MLQWFRSSDETTGSFCTQTELHGFAAVVVVVVVCSIM